MKIMIQNGKMERTASKEFQKILLFIFIMKDLAFAISKLLFKRKLFNSLL